MCVTNLSAFIQTLFEFEGTTECGQFLCDTPSPCLPLGSCLWEVVSSTSVVWCWLLTSCSLCPGHERVEEAQAWVVLGEGSLEIQSPQAGHELLEFGVVRAAARLLQP